MEVKAKENVKEPAGRIIETLLKGLVERLEVELVEGLEGKEGLVEE